jgi:hypothetical protein
MFASVNHNRQSVESGLKMHEVSDIMVQIADGLTLIHGNGKVQYDLMPRNSNSIAFTQLM